MFVTIIAVELSLQYQYTHWALKGCVKLRCLLNIAQVIVKNPRVKGKTRRIFRFHGRCVRSNSGIGILKMSRSDDKLKLRFTIR